MWVHNMKQECEPKSYILPFFTIVNMRLFFSHSYRASWYYQSFFIQQGVYKWLS